MNRFINVVVRLFEDAGFFDWQNEVTRDTYHALGQACAVNETFINGILESWEGAA